MLAKKLLPNRTLASRTEKEWKERPASQISARRREKNVKRQLNYVEMKK
jgi:hypothetical protein